MVFHRCGCVSGETSILRLNAVPLMQKVNLPTHRFYLDPLMCEGSRRCTSIMLELVMLVVQPNKSHIIAVMTTFPSPSAEKWNSVHHSITKGRGTPVGHPTKPGHTSGACSPLVLQTCNLPPNFFFCLHLAIIMYSSRN